MLNYMLIKHKNIFIVLVVFEKCFYFEKFQKFQKLCNPVLATCLTGQASREPTQKVFTTLWRVKALVMRVTQKISWLPTRLTHGWNFQSRKALRQIFPNFVVRVFGGLPWRLVRNSIQSRKSCVLCFQGLFSGQFLKNFSVFPCSL